MYLGRAIRSCLNQSLKDVEVIVVDDCSTDDSRAVIQTMPVVPVLLPKNVGVAAASNEGIRKATGEYIIRVDSDDYVNQNTFLFLSQILEWNKDIGFVYTDHLKVNDKEHVIGRGNLNTLDLLYRHGAGIMFRKSYLEAIGLYDEKLRNAEDYDLLKRYIKNFNGYHLPLPLYRYRQHDTNMTNDEEERKRWESFVDENRK